MNIDSYYQTRKALNDIEEPYKRALDIMEDMYFDPPADGCPVLDRKAFHDIMVMSAVCTIVTQLKKERATFPASLLYCHEYVWDQGHENNMSFNNFHVNKSYEAAVIFGCVYYVLTFDGSIPQKHLDKIEKLFVNDEKALPYFKVFKDAVADRRNELQDKPQREMVEELRQTADDKRIVLSENHNSDFTRIVQAMYSASYFCHADGSEASATEVGEMLLPLMGVGTVWKSMLQKAWSRDNPLKTFDELRDAAEKYWAKRAGISDK